MAPTSYITSTTASSPNSRGVLYPSPHRSTLEEGTPRSLTVGSQVVSQGCVCLPWRRRDWARRVSSGRSQSPSDIGVVEVCAADVRQTSRSGETKSEYGKSSLWKPTPIRNNRPSSKADRLARQVVDKRDILEEQALDSFQRYRAHQARKVFVQFGKGVENDAKAHAYLALIARRKDVYTTKEQLNRKEVHMGRPMLVPEACSGRFLAVMSKVNEDRVLKGLAVLPVRNFAWNDLFSPRHDLRAAGVGMAERMGATREDGFKFVFTLDELQILVPAFYAAIARSGVGRVTSILLQNLQYENSRDEDGAIEMARRIRHTLRRFVSKRGGKKVTWSRDLLDGVHQVLNRYGRHARRSDRERKAARDFKVSERMLEEQSLLCTTGRIDLSSTYFECEEDVDDQDEAIEMSRHTVYLQEQGLFSKVSMTHEIGEDTKVLLDGLRSQVQGLMDKGISMHHSICANSAEVNAWPIDMIHRFILLATQILQASSWSDVVVDVLAFMSHYVSVGPVWEWVREGALWLAQFLYSHIATSQPTHELEEQALVEITSALNPDSFGATIRKWGQVAAGINQLQRLFEPVVSRILNAFYEFVGMQSPNILADTHPDVCAWIDELADLAARGGVSVLASDPVVASNHSGILGRGMALTRSFYSSKPSKEAIAVFQHSLRFAKELDSAAVGAVKNRRQVPVCIYMYGAPGVGKSTILNLLVDAICQRQNISGSSLQIYRPPAQSDYWEGYNQQAFVWLDDVFQSTSVEDNRRTAMTIIDAVGNLPFPLNMAEAGSKGKFFFNSKYICVTSNVSPSVPSNSIGIVSSAAFARRLHITTEIVPEPTFCDGKGRLDPGKVQTALGVPIHVDAIRFRVNGVVMKFAEFVDLVLAREVEHANEFRALTSNAALGEEFAMDADTVKAISEVDGLDTPDTFAEGDGYRIKMHRMVKRWKSQLNYYMSPVFKEHRRMIVSLGGLALGIGALVWTVSSRKRSEIEREALFPSGDVRTAQYARRRVIKEGLFPSGDPRTAQYARKRTLKVPAHGAEYECLVRELQEEGSDDPNALDLLRGRLSAQVYRFTTVNGEQGSTAHMCFLTDRIANVPFHMKQKIDSSTHLVVIGREYREIPRDSFTIMAESREHDLLLLRLADPFPGCRNIIHQFVHEKDVDSINSTACLLTRLLPNSSSECPLMVMFMRDVSAQCISDPMKDGQQPLLQRGFAYKSAQTALGDCGAPLVAMNRFIQSKLLGFHYAGYKGQSGGFASIVTQQLLSRLCGAQPADVDHVLEHQAQDDAVSVCEMARGFDVVGLVPSNMAPYAVTKTTIRKSPLFTQLSRDWAPARTAPALLERSASCDPMGLAQMKYIAPPIFYTIPISTMNLLKNYLVRHYGSRIRTGRKLRVLGIQDALNGLADVENMRRINMDTSSGWPWNKWAPGKKRAWIEEDDMTLKIKSERLEMAVVERVSAARRGIPTPTVWVDTLKDERRPLAKVAAGKTRLFMTGPVDYTIAFRMFFLDMQAAIMEKHLEVECAVGINPHSLEWTTIWDRLNEIAGDNYIAGDFSSYDGSIPAQFIMATADVTNALYADSVENQSARLVLMREVCNATHLCGRIMYKVYRGNPSGNPFTTIMNSFVNTMLLQYAWLRCGWDLSEYDTHVRAVNYGDDNLLKVSSLASVDHPGAGREKFSMRNIARYLQEIGVTYTAASKDGHEFDFISGSEVSFLKRRFVRDLESSRMLAPLDTTSRDEMLYWYRERPDGDVFYQLEQQIDSHLTECAHYGRQFYDVRRTYLMEWLLANKDMEFANQHMPSSLAGKILKTYDYVRESEFGFGH